MRVSPADFTAQTSLVLIIVASALVAAAEPSLDTPPRGTSQLPGGANPPSHRTARTADSYRVGGQIEFINAQIKQSWDEYGIRPSPPANEGHWCRRLYLDLLGRIPTVDELRRFLKSRSRTKQEELVDQLLFDEQYADSYARNWSTLWTNTLIGRSGGNNRRDFTDRDGLRAYLRTCFTSNRPYDQMVYELVTSTGANAAGETDFNGAVNFLIGKLDQDAVEATAETAKVFLGQQVQCTQCHNHPFNGSKQNEFWELNAFFRQTVALRRYVAGTDDIRSVRLENQDFPGEGVPPTPEKAEIYYELRNGILHVAYPAFLDGTPRPELASGYLDDVNRRQELGQLIVRSPSMAPAIVNRMWAHFLGYGFTKPIDDMGPHNPPSHPALLEYLADQFRQQDCDLKQLIRWIVLSQPYGLSSQITKSNRSDDPTMGEPPKFSHFYMRQMRAEQLYESLLVATEAHKTRGQQQAQERAKHQWLKQFVIAFGTDEGDETTTFNGTIPQALMMFNGDLIKQATSTDKGNLLSRIVNGPERPVEKIEHLFLAGLARQPSRRELQSLNQMVAGYGGDTRAALRDVWWAVLNSNEFILNH